MGVKCSVYIAASVDGFIADARGGIEWLQNPAYASPETGDFGYGDFVKTVDALVMGRNTFEKIMTFPVWPYRIPVVVLTSKKRIIPSHLHDQVSLDVGDPRAIVNRLAAKGHRHLYIDGGLTVQRFLQNNLINELTITRIPILLGGGISLFGSAGAQAELRLVALTPYANGFVQMKYEVVYGEQIG